MDLTTFMPLPKKATPAATPQGAQHHGTDEPSLLHLLSPLRQMLAGNVEYQKLWSLATLANELEGADMPKLVKATKMVAEDLETQGKSLVTEPVEPVASTLLSSFGQHNALLDLHAGGVEMLRAKEDLELHTLAHDTEARQGVLRELQPQLQYAQPSPGTTPEEEQERKAAVSSAFAQDRSLQAEIAEMKTAATKISATLEFLSPCARLSIMLRATTRNDCVNS